jgi:hypothetical protein
MPDRRYLTEEEHVKLVEVGNTFWEAFGKLVAEAVNQFPPELEGEVMMYIEDRCSAHGSGYSEHLREDR